MNAAYAMVSTSLFLPGARRRSGLLRTDLVRLGFRIGREVHAEQCCPKRRSLGQTPSSLVRTVCFVHIACTHTGVARLHMCVCVCVCVNRFDGRQSESVTFVLLVAL